MKCPDCSIEISSAARCSCGWGAPKSSREARWGCTLDLEANRCHWAEMTGEPCDDLAIVGVRSVWFCVEHSFRVDQKVRIIEPTVEVAS